MSRETRDSLRAEVQKLLAEKKAHDESDKEKSSDLVREQEAVVSLREQRTEQEAQIQSAQKDIDAALNLISHQVRILKTIAFYKGPDIKVPRQLAQVVVDEESRAIDCISAELSVDLNYT